MELVVFLRARKFIYLPATLRLVFLSGRIEIKLNIFVEKFYNCYRDGLSGGRDMRSFSGLYFILRIVLVIVNDLDSSLNVVAFYVAVILSSTALLIAFVKPYKRIMDNLSDTLLLALLTLLILSFNLISSTYKYVVSMAIIFIPLVMFLFVFMWKQVRKCGSALHKLKSLYCNLLGMSVPPRVATLESSTTSPLVLSNMISVSFGSCENN